MVRNLLNTGRGTYPNINDTNFYKKISSKKEFFDNNIENRYKDVYCLEPQQRFLSNFINPLTLYNSVLVYHSVGVGKTLTAISIAENFKNHYNILILTKNKNLELNFKKQLTGICSNYFQNKEEYDIYYNPNHENYETINNRVKKEINKHYEFSTYGMLVNNVLGKKVAKFFDDIDNERQIIDTRELKNINNTVLIIDEVHNITGNDAYIAVMTLLKNSTNVKIVLLSATPIYDNIKELFEIANLLGDNLPIRKNLVKNKLIEQHPEKHNKLLRDTVNHLTPKGKNMILDSLKGKVSYLLTDTKLFPQKIHQGSPITNNPGSINIYKCIMSPFQENVYNKTLSSRETGSVDNIKDLSPLITDNTNTLFKNSSNALTIVYPDGSYGKQGFIDNIIKNKDTSFLKLENIGIFSCKLYNILININHSPGPCFIYSNLVNFGGTSLIKETLLRNGYSSYGINNTKPKFILLDDTVKPIKKQKLLKIFNNSNNAYGKIIKIIIGSPVVAEGITFKNIRQIHILEPYWNLSRTEQIIGRGVRFKSHQDLPPKDRKTEMFLHTAMTSSSEYNSIDYLKYQMSEEKDRVIKNIEYDIKTIAIDCYTNKNRNKLSSTFDNSRECQYTSCNYSCPWEDIVTSIDDSTYSLTNHDIEKYNFILKQIKELYQIGHIFDLQNILFFIQSKTSLKISNENIYFVLQDIINTPITLFNPLNKKCNLIAVDNYYLLNPEDNEIYEPFFNKIYKKSKTSKTLNQVLNIPIIKPQKSKKHLIKISKNILNEPIVGSYIDKLGINDNKFRIIDNRPPSKTTEEDHRKLTSGKVCLSFSKEELKEIFDFLNIKSLTNISKQGYCLAIENHLKSKNKIII